MTDALTDQGGRSATAPTDESGTISTVAQQATDEAGTLVHDAGDEVRAVAHTAKREAASFASGAREQLGREADDAAHRAASALTSTAHDLTAMADGNGSADAPAANVVREIGVRVERVAEHLQERGYQGVADDVSRWARNHPGTFLLAAAGAGFALGRIFRSVDTGAVVDAAKEGAGMGDADDGRELPSGATDPRGAYGLDPGHAPPTVAAAVDAPPVAAPAFVAEPIDLTEGTAPPATTRPVPGGAGPEVRP